MYPGTSSQHTSSRFQDAFLKCFPSFVRILLLVQGSLLPEVQAGFPNGLSMSHLAVYDDCFACLAFLGLTLQKRALIHLRVCED